MVSEDRPAWQTSIGNRNVTVTNFPQRNVPRPRFVPSNATSPGTKTTRPSIPPRPKRASALR
jgi:hypothetical protein